MHPESILSALSRKHPLPEGWSASEAVIDRCVADELVLYRAGLSATGPGLEANGAAVALDASPVERAYFELVERASLLAAIRDPGAELELRTFHGEPDGTAARADVFPESDEPDSWRPARSNGVALHTSWSDACRRAFWELAERDRVLRAWRGEIDPVRIDMAPGDPLVTGTPSYEFRAYSFPAGVAAAWSAAVHVVGVYGFPREPKLPLVYGYGARPDLDAARAGAIAEATQLLGFLWGESIPEREPDLAPGAPYHLDYYLVPERHETLRRWLEGGHRTLPKDGRATGDDRRVRFVDLAPARETGLFVAKAMCDAAVPLAFGRGPWTAHMPESLQVHPIA